MNGQTNKEMGRQTDRQRQKKRLIDEQTDRHMCTHTNGWTDRKANNV